MSLKVKSAGFQLKSKKPNKQLTVKDAKLQLKTKPVSREYLENCVLELRLDGGAGNIAHDTSGKNNDCAINGATWTDGKYGKALSFDGSNDYVEKTSPTGLPTLATDPFTMSFWIYLSEAETDGAVFVGFGYGVQGGSRYVIQWNGHIYFWGDGVGDVDSGVAFDVGAWQLITITWDGTNLGIYKNTTLIETATPTIVATTPYISIGRSHSLDAWQNYLKGIIDEVRVYNRVLTEAEILQHYNEKLVTYFFPLELKVRGEA